MYFIGVRRVRVLHAQPGRSVPALRRRTTRRCFARRQRTQRCLAAASANHRRARWRRVLLAGHSCSSSTPPRRVAGRSRRRGPRGQSRRVQRPTRCGWRRGNSARVPPVSRVTAERQHAAPLARVRRPRPTAAQPLGADSFGGAHRRATARRSVDDHPTASWHRLVAAARHRCTVHCAVTSSPSLPTHRGNSRHYCKCTQTTCQSTSASS